jgi:signal transduction histidine kinase
MNDSVNNQTNSNGANISQELAHVTQEMYKKNLELAEKNKTLSLLQKIEEIILGSLTDLQQISQQITKVMVEEADFQLVSIFLINNEKKTFIPLAISHGKNKQTAEFDLQNVLRNTMIPLDDINIFSKAYREAKKQITYNLADVLSPTIEANIVDGIQKKNQINSILIYPLILHEKVIGIMMISLGDADQHLFEYRKDLVDRLPGIIEITMNNAFLYRNIQAANARLKELDKLKDEFLSIASHELRTPMTAIRSYLWLALSKNKGEMSDKQKFYIERSYSSTERLIKLVNDLLSVSRIEGGRIDLVFENIDLDKVIEDTIIEILPRANELGISINVDPHDRPPLVSADQDKIKEVLINLMGNSLKFTPKGGAITIILEKKDDTMIVHVKDNGQGIAPENISKLFQKFNLIKDSYTVNNNIFQGTGLGLYICKSVINLHGGEIWVESEGKGKGSVFSFTLKISK